jgi:hypothetical protein
LAGALWAHSSIIAVIGVIIVLDIAVQATLVLN